MFLKPPLSTLHNLLKISSAQCPRGIVLRSSSFFFSLFIAPVASGFWIHLFQQASNAGDANIGDDYGINPILKLLSTNHFQL